MKESIYDHVIIGSGPAGSVLAYKLAKNNFKIALIDRAESKTQHLNKKDYILNPYIQSYPGNYFPAYSNQLGGNSALWNHKIYLISKDEFNSDDWPFKYDELVKYSKNLAREFNINHNNICNIEIINSNKISSSSREKKLGNLFNYLNINKIKNIDVYDSSSPVSIKLNNNNKVTSINLYNKKKKLFSEIFLKNSLIFCAGGLGNPHLIKNLLKRYPKLIGKNLCDHPHFNFFNVADIEAKKNIKYSKFFINRNKRERNIYIKLKEGYFSGIQLDSLRDSTEFLKRYYLKINFFLFKKIFFFFISAFSLFSIILNRIYFILKIKNKFSYQFFFSQGKFLNNSINLNKKKRDEFGLSKANINWRITGKDKKFYLEIINKFNQKRTNYRKNIKDKNISLKEKDAFVGLHPSCTTISGNKIRNSCVDENLKLWGYKNIFVCGSSVFAGNGFTNPTWTIMVMSNRLAKFLKKFKIN